MRSYRLMCCGCGADYDDDGVQLDCTNAHPPALLRSVYRDRSFDVDPDASIFRYRKWLPRAREIATDARTAVYRSTGLAAYLGLRNLWIAFNGWWPERGATLPTATFKDLEAIAVLSRISGTERRVLVISSAGNTAAAFARICSENDMPALIVVPLDAWDHVMATGPCSDVVRFVGIARGKYQEAIGFARDLAATGEFILEGGVRNVARRDGMGTVMLAAVEAIGELPSHYFQAVGSGAGALAAHEAALRMRADGRYGTTLPRLMLSQNAPFTPIHDAWTNHARDVTARDCAVAQKQIAQLGATVLSNQAPPYGIAGGLYEALAATSGKTFSVTNDAMDNALSVFAELEGIDIEPAAGITIASLVHAVRAGDVDADDTILVNVTGGGRKARLRTGAQTQAPALVLDRSALGVCARDRVRSLFA